MPTMTRLRFIPTMLAVIAILTCTGCVREAQHGDEMIYSYEWWVPLTVVLAGLAALAIGVGLFVSASKGAWALMLIGPGAALLFAPSLFLESVRVSPERFVVKTGIWGTNSHEVKFADVATINVTSESRRSRRGTSTSYFFVCHKKDGSSDKVPMNNGVSEAAAPAIVAHCDARGIPVVDQTEQ